MTNQIIVGEGKKPGMEWNGINWSMRHSSFIEQALHFYEITLFTHLYTSAFRDGCSTIF